jgi:hypothetical protein
LHRQRRCAGLVYANEDEDSTNHSSKGSFFFWDRFENPGGTPLPDDLAAKKAQRCPAVNP